MLNKKIFSQYIVALQSLYDKELSEVLMELYYKALEGLTDEQFKNGINKLIKTRVYAKFPQPGEILQSAIGDVENNKICYAADNLRKAVTQYGAHYSVIFEDPIIHIILEKHFGSWIKFCSMAEDEQKKFFKFEFENLYKAYSSQRNSKIKTVMLGKHDAINEGKYLEEVGKYQRYIGDKEKALKWISAYEAKELENKTNKVLPFRAQGASY